MINLHLSLRNPWYSAEDFKNLFCRSGMLSRHRAWEFEICRDPWNLAEVTVRWSIRSDHAGLEMDVGLIGYQMSFSVRDTRHWDIKNKCWEVYQDE